MLENYRAIKQLEETIIPWQNDGHGTPTRPLREASKTNPLRAAEGLLGGGSRTGSASARDSGAIPESIRQSRALLDWAKKSGRLISSRFEDRLVNIGGVEHDVLHDQETGRWIKFTLPGKGGKEIRARRERLGVRPTLATEDASLDAYLRRLTLANQRLGDDFWLHGVMDTSGGPRIVVSQRHIAGRPATLIEIANHFVQEGFLRVTAKTFYHPSENLLVSDAHQANVFRTPMGVVPFDVGVQHPTDDLLLAMRPAPVLSFEDMVQPHLEPPLEF